MAEAFMSQGRCPAPQCLGGREHSISCANYRVEMKIQVQRAENFDSILCGRKTHAVPDSWLLRLDSHFEGV